MGDGSIYIGCAIDIEYWYGVRNCCVKDSSMKSPPAPESMSALVLMVRSSQVIETGIRIDCLDTSATITGETVISRRRDIDAADHFKNPPALLA